ncbi:MAG TPA: MarR family transcriptional regulator [Acidimicrobiales bacterium]
MSRNVRSSREKSRADLIEELESVIRVQQRAVDLFDQAVVDMFGLNRTDGRLIDLLEEQGPMSAGELARAAHLSTGAVTTAVDRLVERGLVQRMADPTDRRRVIIGITDKTMRALVQIYGPLVTEARTFLEQFTNSELEAIIRFYRLDLELHQRHAQALAKRRAATARKQARSTPTKLTKR